MDKKIILNGEELVFKFTSKNVKNINLRISADGDVSVSAPFSKNIDTIYEFLYEHADWILHNRNLAKTRKLETEEKPQLAPKQQISTQAVTRIFDEAYQAFEPTLIMRPLLAIKPLKSMWGSCNRRKYTVTLSTDLLYTSERLLEYVIYHEFAHFTYRGHQADFYNFLGLYMPDYMKRKKELRQIRMT